jgi:hypothetical protein
MIQTARFLGVLKRLFKRLNPGKPATVVRTLAEEGRGEIQVAQPVSPLTPSVKARTVVTDDGLQTDCPPQGYPTVLRYPASFRKSAIALKNSPDIDLASLNDLEACAEALTLPAETIESWVGAGILSPRETEIAEKLIRIMRAKDTKKISAKRTPVPET